MVTITPHLKAYLDSYGSRLPEDADEHIDGIFRDRCLFCTRNHDNIAVYQYDVSIDLETSYVSTLAKCCRECSQLINDMVVLAYPELRDEQIQTKFEPSSKKYPGMDESTKYRIRIFNSKKGLERFDGTLSISYLHVRPDPKQEGAGFSCYFCKGLFSTDNVHGPTKIKVPVYDSKVITGGELTVCESCLVEIWDVEGQEALEAKCSFCSKLYSISPEEHNIRVAQNTVGKHMCPACVHGGLNDEVFNPKRSILFSNIEIIKRGERFDFLNCYQCDTQFVVDFTLDHVRLKRTRQIDGKPICGICFTFKLGKTNGNKLVFQYKDSGYYIVINQIDGYWVYRISSIKDGQEYVELKPDVLGSRSKNILETIDVGHDQCMKLVNPQLKLDLDGNE